jgi:hypothetical protein
MSTSPAVAHCIEVLCHKGCRQVRRDIAALEQGQSLPETQGLDPAERVEVLAELRAIMAVYGDRCSLD